MRHAIKPPSMVPGVVLAVTMAMGAGMAQAHQPAPKTAHHPDNRAIVTDFAHLFYTERRVEQAFNTYVVPDYIQHNPGLADGRAAAIAMLAPMFADTNKSFEIRKIMVDGDLAAIHIFVRPSPGARGAAVADFYRLKDGKIVEHWDIIQPIPEKSANPHPMF